MANARYLDATDLAALLTPKDSVAVLTAALARLSADGVGGLEWKSSAGGKAPPGSAALLRGGQPVLLADAATFAALRGAASALLVAGKLADPKLEVITLLGCNATGRAFMAGAVPLLPDLQRMLCYDPNITAQGAFADAIMTTHDVASIIPTDPREAVEGAQLLVSCMQPTAAKPFVEPDWLQRGTTCVLLDGTETFTTATLAGAARRLTDDLAAWRAAAAQLPGVAAPEGDLSALAAGKLPPRTGTPLIISVHFGAPSIDAALAAELLARAEAAGRGKQVAL
jgi:ornithine cyclodeaminase/alanine dehydrogenase-like protein (mu-crystallin family)